VDAFVKNPDAALRFILPPPSRVQAYCGVRARTPIPSGFAHLACGAFCAAVIFNFFQVLQGEARRKRPLDNEKIKIY
jgi:hypothetical protein